ncbi:SgcJ/EcaC family oxidoreductase [Sphaerisporangium sp. TRM90804]|uniref:SgcJ/EcaC family oxidoreductase n=1 Tax=Sphaerisporangium sp. TRM90804 TaxID=3031113 RepID=UPI0024480588|nr:SgcJ/EcaC family oxidoreductase [Sphaerisporangium sp. TRM90804]MDH2429250.1 SgcJ/EcaC family oxidoreductase [Sphaerisporangium sp. TRM90804]
MSGQVHRTPESAPAQEIDDLLGRMTEAWNAGDATAYAGQFTEDADYVTFFGMHLTGRRAIEESHRALFEGPLRGSRLTGGTGGEQAPAIRFLRPDVAVVVMNGGSSVGGEQSPERDSIITLTAVREPDAWRFASFQNTRKVSMESLGAPGRPGGREGR